MKKIKYFISAIAVVIVFSMSSCSTLIQALDNGSTTTNTDKKTDTNSDKSTTTNTDKKTDTNSDKSTTKKGKGKASGDGSSSSGTTKGKGKAGG